MAVTFAKKNKNTEVQDSNEVLDNMIVELRSIDIIIFWNACFSNFSNLTYRNNFVKQRIIKIKKNRSILTQISLS